MAEHSTFNRGNRLKLNLTNKWVNYILYIFNITNFKILQMIT